MIGTPARFTNVVGRFDQPVFMAELLNGYTTLPRCPLDSVLRKASAAAVAFAASELAAAALTTAFRNRGMRSRWSMAATLGRAAT
ncbi:MAG TPA: hypothetical protein VH231_00835, partial [Solirubrobacteraceae bacterium]|nr:hypothetical protein [Solirubrobacteraceae bacterium]